VISREDVEHVARLARLALTEAECLRMREQLDGILAYIDTLRALDTSATGPTSHALPLVNVMRDDENRPCLGQEAALANAPERAGAFFRVPKIIEESS
jgi:aspartyl-tRNA(Asn)/glutamyl-tRNA(Gln) amidotransferase subunit C